jgi:hypothetical protein
VFFKWRLLSSLKREILPEIGIFLIFFFVTVGLQWLGGAFFSEPGRFPDEGAHYVTGLLVRDYVASGFPGNPIKFAENFYTHFPKVAFGVWPPLFHLMMGIWLLPTPDGRTSVLLLMAFIMAAAAYILYRSLRAFTRRSAAFVVGLLLVLLPVSQWMTSTIMADSLVMLTVVASAAATARWLRTGSNRDAVWVGICAGMALMSKGNGAAVIPAVPIAVVLARRLDLLRKPGIYIAGAIAGVLGLLWQIHSLKLYRQMSSFHAFTLAGIGAAFRYYVSFVFHAVGWMLCLFIIVGLVTSIALVRDRKQGWNVWAAMGATAFSVMAFHVVIPHPADGRYALAAIAPSLVFLIPAAWKTERLFHNARAPAVGHSRFLMPCLLGLFVAFFFYVPRMPQFGYRQAVAWLKAHPQPGQRYLIISDGEGEGAFISEVASSTNRTASAPMVMRGTKLLFVSDWFRNGYKLVYDNPQKILEDIEGMGVCYIVVDHGAQNRYLPHWQQVGSMEHASASLQLVAGFPAGEGGTTRSLNIYKVLHYADPPAKRFVFQTIYTRGGSIGE